MNLVTLIYIGGFIENIITLLNVTMVTSLMLIPILKLGDSIFEKKSNISTRMLFIVFVVSSLLLVFIPKPATYYAMVTVNMGQEVVKNKDVSETLDKAFKLINKELDTRLSK